jgi:excinuclease ABC subunit C
MSQKIPQLVSRTEQIKWQETNTDISATLLQIEELYKYKPEFNSQHFNEKTYSFIKITQDSYPAVFRCSHIKKDNADYIGPFSNRFLIDNIMLNVRQNFRIRNCRGKLTDTENCIYHNMACCFSPCTNEVSEIVYHEEIGKLKQYILKGYEAELINEINILSDKMEFESAFLRNQLFDLKNIKLNPTSDEIHLFNSHYIAILPYGENSEMCMLFVKSGLLMRDIVISEDTDQTTIYDAIVSTFSDLSIKINYSKQEIQQCLMMQTFLSRGNGDVNIIEVTNESTDLDIFEECGTFLDNFFVK